ncbi:N/A [soil metagenome]
MRAFYLAWFGQLVSQMGSGLTAFALSVWVYQQTHSVTKLTFIQFFAMLPMIAFFPIAGALTDRWDRRRVLILSEVGSALAPLVLAALLAIGRVEIWHIYVCVAVSSGFMAFQFPAFSAATTMLVPKDQLGRASGMVQVGVGSAQLLSPILGAVLLSTIGLRGVFVIDIATFVVAIALLASIKIPRPAASIEVRARGALWNEMIYGWGYIFARRGLLSLVLLIGTTNFVISTVVALAPALLLSFTNARVLGVVLSAAGIGMLVGSVAISVRKGSGSHVRAVFLGTLLCSSGAFAAGLVPSPLFIGVAAFVAAAGWPIVAASSQAIWQRKVPADLQGRVFAMRAMIAMSAGPLAFLISGPLADRLFIPLLVPHGALTGSVGRIIGVGPTRGIGLMFMVLGAGGALLVAFASKYAPLRFVERDLVDVIPDDERTSASGPPSA